MSRSVKKYSGNWWISAGYGCIDRATVEFFRGEIAAGMTPSEVSNKALGGGYPQVKVEWVSGQPCAAFDAQAAKTTKEE